MKIIVKIDGKDVTSDVSNVTVSGQIYDFKYRLQIPRATLVTFCEFSQLAQVSIFGDNKIIWRGSIEYMRKSTNGTWQCQLRHELNNLAFGVAYSHIRSFTTIYNHNKFKYIKPLELLPGVFSFLCSPISQTSITVQNQILGGGKNIIGLPEPPPELAIKDAVTDLNYLLNINAKKLSNKIGIDYYRIPNYTFLELVTDLLYTLGLFLSHTDQGYMLGSISDLLSIVEDPSKSEYTAIQKKRVSYQGFILDYFEKTDDCQAIYNSQPPSELSVSPTISNTFLETAEKIQVFPIGYYVTNYQGYRQCANTVTLGSIYSGCWDLYSYTCFASIGHFSSLTNQYWKNTIFHKTDSFSVVFSGISMPEIPYGKKKYMTFSHPVKIVSMVVDTDLAPNAFWNIQLDVHGFTRARLIDTGNHRTFRIIQEIEKNGEWQDVQELHEKWWKLVVTIQVHRMPLLSQSGLLFGNGLGAYQAQFEFPTEEPLGIGE